jgi:hypothetical protein
MSTQPQSLGPSAVLPSKAMEVMIRGKVVSARRHEAFHYTLVAIPSPDEWTGPQKVELRSKQKVGTRDEIVTVRARLGGFEGRPFKATDKETGEIRSARSVFHTLDVIE